MGGYIIRILYNIYIDLYKCTRMHTYIHTCIHTYIHTYIYTYRQTDRQADRQTDRQTDRHMDPSKFGLFTIDQRYLATRMRVSSLKTGLKYPPPDHTNPDEHPSRVETCRFH